MFARAARAGRQPWKAWMLAVALASAAPAACAGGVAPIELVPGIWISGQVGIADVDDVGARGFRAVVAMRPDGEQPGQPEADAIGQALERLHVGFARVPVPAAGPADAEVDALSAALAGLPRPVLLYCRSGRRAAVTWALAEASRPAGLDAKAIAAALEAAGQSGSDLQSRLAVRVAARP